MSGSTDDASVPAATSHRGVINAPAGTRPRPEMRGRGRHRRSVDLVSKTREFCGLAAVLIGSVSAAASAAAADWSVTELHYQHGSLAAPAFAGGGTSATDILTLQHASGSVLKRMKRGANEFVARFPKQ